MTVPAGSHIPSIRSERIPPDPKGTSVALRRIDYSLEEALADVIDNSIDASAQRRRFKLADAETPSEKVKLCDKWSQS